MRLYSLYKLYPPDRWVRISEEALPKKEAKEKWSNYLDQTTFMGTVYKIKPLPKSYLSTQTILIR